MNKNVFNPFPLQEFSDGHKDPMQDLEKISKEIKKENIKALRNIFKDDIKETFLIKVYEKIKSEHLDIINYYANPFDFNVEGYLRGENNRIDYDLCCHIVGIHKSNILFLSEEEKGNLQKNPNYINQLCNKVYEHIKLRYYGSCFFRNTSLLVGDRFLYFTMAYDIFVVSTYILSILNDDLHENNFISFYHSIISEAISILTLMENGLLMQAFPQCRNLIELFFKYEVLFNKPDALDEYNAFCQYEIDYALNGVFDDEFQNKYKKHTNNKDINKIDYLHFGWIDEIFDFDYLGKEKKYSIVGLYNYLLGKYKDDKNLLILKNEHNKCHMFSHGSTITKIYPLQSYFELIQVLYIVIDAIMIDIVNFDKNYILVNGINILNKMENDMKDFSLKMKLLSTENIKKYYNAK